MRRVKKSSFIVTALPSSRPLQNHGETFLLTLWLLQWERRTQNCELTYGSHYSNLTPWALQGNLQSSTTTVVRLHLAGGAGGGVLQHTNPGRLNSHLQWPSSNPNQWLCLSAEPNWGAHFDQGTQMGADRPNSSPQMRASASPRAQSALPKQKAESRHHSLKSVF